MLYSFACKCGNCCQVELAATKIIGHRQRCNECNDEMGRDYQREGAKIAMSSCEKNVFPYKDVTLGRTIYSQKDRKQEMKRQGLVDNEPSNNVMARTREIKRAGRTSIVVPSKGGE
jgi:hypothetical protein